MQTTGTNALITLPEAAHRLSQSWEQTWRQVLSGTLVGRKIKARWFVEESSVEELKQLHDSET